MLLPKGLGQVVKIAQSIVKKVERRFRAWTEPSTDRVIGGIAADLVKSKRPVIRAKACLRQPVIVLKRHMARPHLSANDRGRLILLARRIHEWKTALLIVKPATLLHWHRPGVHLFWKAQSTGQARTPRLAAATIALSKPMAVDNRRWGTQRIRGALLKLGLRLNKGTIRHSLWPARRQLPPPHHGQGWACDFVQTYALFFRAVLLCFIIDHGSRRVVHGSVTRTPTDAWVAQPVRAATPFGEAPRCLIGDTDDQDGACVEQAVTGVGIELIHTPPPAPKANARGERFIGTVRRDCVDHPLIVSDQPVRRVIHEDCQFFKRARPHQALNQQSPEPANVLASPAHAPRQVIARPLLGG
jgi:putative transposase